MPHKKHKKKSPLIIWMEFIPFISLYRLVRMLPFKTAYMLNKLIFRLLFVIDRKHRNRSIQHILHAKIKENKPAAKKLALASFDSFAKLLVEIIKSDQHYSPDKISATGCQATIDKTLNKNGDNINVILVTAHYGNWEVAGHAWAEYTGIPMSSIMRPFNNPLIGKLILKNRASALHEMVPKQGGVKGILKALKQHKIATFLVDQHASTKDGGVETIFFGQPCRTHTAPALLHLRTGVPIMPELTRRVDDNFSFEFKVGELIEYTPTDDKEQDIKNIAQLYTTALEKMIAEDPEQWLWTHRRWLNINRNRKSSPKPA
jgi:Kdo2-lipid IVA lauroyltransferase/acyltransferase